MARVILGGGISSINGSIGGTTFQSGSSGTIAKNKGHKTKSNSFQSSVNKVNIAYVSQLWSNMSASDREAWNSYAIFKPVTQKNNSGRFLSGQQLFFLYNYAGYYQSEAIINTPSFSTEVITLTSLRIVNDGGTLYINSDVAINEAINFLIAKISSPVKPSQKRSVGGVKQIYCEFSSTTDMNITSQYQSLFGIIPSVGQSVEVEFQMFSSTTENWSNKIKVVTIVEAP